ncbi:MAG TPA: acyl-CoA dehydrogenase family protein [Chloroflexota bacterium]|nr:acyl-CoA dehydrogenase family protein [Chloroflexota bacterium]
MLNYFDIELSDQERLVQRTTREWVESAALPIIAECFEEGKFPTQLVPQMAELGLLGATIPEYGAGMPYTIYGLICQELERCDSGLRSFVSVQSSLCMFPIYTFGTEEQKERYLPKMVRGELIGCFGLTEPDHGSDPAGMETRARRDGAGWVLSGTKMWITNGSIADLAVIWARADDGIRGFLVETDSPGFSARNVERKLSLRASVTSELHLDDVRLPGSALLPGTSGLGPALRCLNEARFGIAWGAVGAAMTCFESALEYSKLRPQFGRPIAGFQLTQSKLADMLTGITQGQLLALQLGRLKDAGRLRPAQISLAKRANAMMALEVARTARSILGGNGISLEHPVFRHMVNLETVITYEGTHEIHTLVLGQDLTGIGAFT